MKEKLKALENEIFKHRKVRRLKLIKEAFIDLHRAYVSSLELEPKKPWWKRWLKR